MGTFSSREKRTPPDSFAIARLAGSDGRERWRANLHGAAQTHNHVPRDLATAIAVDPTQDVVAVGQMANRDVLGANADFTVLKLADASGAEQWRFTLPYSITYAHLVAVDRAGSVIAAGEGRPFGSSPMPAVVKLAGDTGEMLWHSDPAATVDARAMVLDAGGDVFLAGTARGDGNDFGVLKLSGTTGEVLWSASISASGDRWEAALALSLDGAGGVVAAGLTAEPGGEVYEDEGVHFTVARFDTANGNRLWSYSRTGTSGRAHAVAIVGGDTVVAVGNSVGKKTCGDGLLIALDVTTGGLLQSRSFDGAVSAPRCRPQCERMRAELSDRRQRWPFGASRGSARTTLRQRAAVQRPAPPGSAELRRPIRISRWRPGPVMTSAHVRERRKCRSINGGRVHVGALRLTREGGNAVASCDRGEHRGGQTLALRYRPVAGRVNAAR